MQIEEKLKLYDFLRPGSREAIQAQLDYLNNVMSDLRKQVLKKDTLFRGTFGALGSCRMRFSSIGGGLPYAPLVKSGPFGRTEQKTQDFHRDPSVTADAVLMPSAEA